jgi:hypothetical protein
MTFLAIDPGVKGIGWAWFDDSGETTGFGDFGSIDEFLDWLDAGPVPDVLIFENYTVNPTVPHGFSKVEVVECIGGIKRYARKHKIKLVEQRNLVLRLGLQYLGFVSQYYSYHEGKWHKKKHVDDKIAALAHGEYYLVSQKIKKHRRATEQ